MNCHIVVASEGKINEYLSAVSLEDPNKSNLFKQMKEEWKVLIKPYRKHFIKAKFCQEKVMEKVKENFSRNNDKVF